MSVDPDLNILAREILKDWAESPWKQPPNIEKIQEFTEGLQAELRGTMSRKELSNDPLYKALCIMNGFLFNFAIQDLQEKSAARALQTGFEIGQLYSVIMAMLAAAKKSPGRPDSETWKYVERVYRDRMANGLSVTEGAIWNLCKDGLGISRDSFHVTFVRKKKGWGKIFPVA